MILIFYGGMFGINRRKDVFLLTLNEGNLFLNFGGNRFLTTAENHNLDDGQWHHIAIIMPSKSCLMSQVQMTLDGMDTTTSWNGNDDHIFFVTSGKLSLGGLGYSSSKFDSEYSNISNFNGMMDNFWLWEDDQVSSPPTPAPVSGVPNSHPCNDSPLRFRVLWNDESIARDCTWVANRATKQKCGVDGVGSMCPVTCGTCNNCEDSTVRFKVTMDGKKISRDCSWVASRSTSMRCNLPGVSDSCRSTCQKC